MAPSIEKCTGCVQRTLLTCWVLLVVIDVMYMCIASASLAYFGDFRDNSFVYYRRVNIETLVVAALGGVSGAFGVFGTVRIKRRVVFGSMLSLLATFALLVAAYVSLRQMKNPFEEHSSTSEPTSEAMDREIAAYKEFLDVNVTGAANISRAEATAALQLRFMNVGQRIFQCCGKGSYRDYGDKILPRSCCRDLCHCPTRARRPTARVFDTSLVYGVGCVVNMYTWVVLVTLAGLNLAAFCLVAFGCLLFSCLFLYLHRNKERCGTPPRSVRSVSHRSLAGTSMVLVVLDDSDVTDDVDRAMPGVVSGQTMSVSKSQPTSPKSSEASSPRVRIA